ncbi:MAG: hypothetical protein ACPG75_04975 [Alloalcanivorax venustensis]
MAEVIDGLDPVTLAVLSTSSALVVGLLIVVGALLFAFLIRPGYEQALDEDEPYLLQNVTAGYVGNAPLWWRAGGSGYTPWPDEAERFTLADARQVVRSTVGTHKWAIYPELMILEQQRATVDAQHLGDPMPFVVELETGVWMADWEGDPGRTLQRDNAQRFADQYAAEAALRTA